GFESADSAINQGTFTIQSGTKSATITIDSTNNTVKGLAQAISSANIGISASVISDGTDARTQPYRLLLTAQNSGTDNAIVITNNLDTSSGGSIKPNLSSTQIGQANKSSSFGGSASVTSNEGGGTYTGTSNDTFSFTVTTAGTVGTDNGIQLSYSNKSGSLTGTLTVNTADLGVSKAVANGITVQFGAGTLNLGDKFTIDGFVPTAQSASNARVQVGAGDGAIVVESATNQINDLIPGVSLNLLAADANKEVKITVGNDIAAAKKEIQDFVTDYNDFVTYLNSQTKFDAAANTSSPLTGFRAVEELRTLVERSILSVSANLPSSYNRLSVLGINSDGKGKLTINETKLDDALNGRVSGVGFDELKKLFGLQGTTSSGSFQFATGSASTKESGASPYQIDITQAAR
ncbi:MAG: hypothetical protein FJ267_16555, partial [Planctomycetes bacterium]|nr:hypothetical protein [Planctomycetota bacterium]